MFNIIVCCDAEYGIGQNNTIPWNIREDLQYFKNITMKNPNSVLIMGRLTADTFPKPLPGRHSIVLTGQADYRADQGFLSSNSFEGCLDLAGQYKESDVFVIGGSGILKNIFDTRQFIQKIDRIYLNQLNKSFDCDVKLPENMIQYIIGQSESMLQQVITTDVTDRDTHENIVNTMKVFKYRNTEELRYLYLLKDIIEKGDRRETRNGVTRSLFGRHLEFDLDNGFPLLTTKKMFLRGIAEELFFFLRGDTDTKILENKKINIWTGNTSREFLRKNNLPWRAGDMGPMYGFQWRNFNAPYQGCDHQYQGIDQLRGVVDLLINDPHSRRILMTTYNPEQANQGCLYPCHGLVVQFYVETDRISLSMYQRSADWFLGVPFNIASYGLLLCVITQLVNTMGQKNYRPGRLVMSFGDLHLYEDHLEQAEQQLSRLDSTYYFPMLRITRQLDTIESLNNLVFEDIVLDSYQSHGPIKASMVA